MNDESGPKTEPVASGFYDKEYFFPHPQKPKSGYIATGGYRVEDIPSWRQRLDTITNLIFHNCKCFKEKAERGEEPVKVLELGGAMGHLSKRIAKRLLSLPEAHPENQVINLDFSAFAVSQSVIKESTVRADMRKIPHPDSAFDLLVSYDALEHLPPEDIQGFLTDTLRVLKPGGEAFFIVTLKSSYEPLKDASHLCSRDEKWWKKEFKKAGFIPQRRLSTVIARAAGALQPILRQPFYAFREGLFLLKKPIENPASSS